MLVASPNMDGAVDALCLRVQDLLKKTTDPEHRLLIAIAGAPGSGKSTIAQAVLQALPNYGITSVQAIPMDGFHYAKAVLQTFADPVVAFQRRGAPFTFDAEAFVQLVSRLRETPVTVADAPETIIRAPSFDHGVQDPVPDDISISSRTKVLLIEGNYTLLDEAPWNRIPAMVDDKWFVDVPAKTILQRLIQRHLRAGIETTEAAACHRAQQNDIPNGIMLRAHLVEPDVRIRN